MQNVKCGNDEWRNYNKDADEKYKDQPERLDKVHQKLSLLRDDPFLVTEAIRVINIQPNYTPAKNKEDKSVKSFESREIYFISPEAAKQNNEYRDYIRNNLKYPKDALNRKAEGTVFLKYDIAKDGSFGNVAIGNDQMKKFYEKNGQILEAKKITYDPALMNEAIRLMKSRSTYIANFDTTKRAAFGMCNIDFKLPDSEEAK